MECGDEVVSIRTEGGDDGSTKTVEEIAQEEEDQLHELEKKRLARIMAGEDDDLSDIVAMHKLVMVMVQMLWGMWKMRRKKRWCLRRMVL